MAEALATKINSPGEGQFLALLQPSENTFVRACESAKAKTMWTILRMRRASIATQECHHMQSYLDKISCGHKFSVVELDVLV